MQVAVTNDVKIYNLSAGKSLPDWISSEQRRKAIKADVDIEKRIELIEDFEMPDSSDCIGISKDGNHLVVTGTYLPTIKCYELGNMALKFERCTYSENVCFEILSDDYSKMVFLQADRHVEIHNQGGKWYRFRLPKVCRDMVYHTTSCDQYFVGSSSQIYRFNLEQGRFLTPLDSGASAINSIQINPEHGLICVGTVSGKVEGWDPRSRTRAAILDCGLQAITPGIQQVKSVPAVTTLAFRDGLNMGVGTSTGLVLMYDIRANKPMLTKDHMYGLPIKKINFHTGYDNDLVLSMDSQTVKIWDRETGKSYTSIEASADFTDLCVYKESGILFMSNNQPKMQTYYIPSLGPAPRWASFLDSLTEELEESKTASVYDDYKFVTREDLHSLGMEHLIGSQLMRAHMHGFYMNYKLYRKALIAQDPDGAEAIKKQYVASEIDKLREKRVKIERELPAVNADLFSRLKEESDNKLRKTKQIKAKEKVKVDILQDDRFSSLFTDKDFQVDPSDDNYKRLMIAVNTKAKGEKRAADLDDDDDDSTDEEEVEARKSEDEDLASSSDEDTKVVAKREARAKAKERREYKANAPAREAEEARVRRKAKQLMLKEKLMNMSTTPYKFSEIQEGGIETKSAKKKSKLSLEERVGSETHEVHATTGETQVTFNLDDRPYVVKEREEKQEQHLMERKAVRRSTKKLKTDKIGPKFWVTKGKR